MADEASELLPKAGAENARKRAEDGTPRGSPTRGVPVPAPRAAAGVLGARRSHSRERERAPGSACRWGFTSWFGRRSPNPSLLLPLMNWRWNLKAPDYREQRRQWHPTPVLLPGWNIPWTEEPGGLQSMGSLRVRHD